MGLFDKMFGGQKDKGKKEVPTGRPPVVEACSEANALSAPVSGRVESVEGIPDPVFSAAVMGKVFALWPTKGVVYAPLTGVVTSAMPHCIGIKGNNGAEVIVHIGVDTIEMDGEGFTVWVDKNDNVKAGDAIVSMDLAKVREAKHPEIVITVLTNPDAFYSVETVSDAEVEAGQKIITLLKEPEEPEPLYQPFGRI